MIFGVRAIPIAWMVCSVSVVLAQAPATISVDEARKDPDFTRQGEYSGPENGVQVVALGNGEFRAVTYQGGLPGAGWDKSSPSTEEGKWEAIEPLLEGLTRTERKSPTLGEAPPENAVSLFAGSSPDLSAWEKGAEKSPEGWLQQGCTTRDKWGDFQLHIEFLLPYMPEARGQARGNSGCYLQGRYEVQMLDSFGLEGKDNECGGIYQVAAPEVNMCLPPLAWQTYDIDFQAARFGPDGKKISNARVTVKHNGVVIHDELELPHVTPGGPLQTETDTPGPIFLQNHFNPVRYRNVWLIAK